MGAGSFLFSEGDMKGFSDSYDPMSRGTLLLVGRMGTPIANCCCLGETGSITTLGSGGAVVETGV